MTIVPHGEPEPVLLSIAEIQVTQSQVITPNGSFPIHGSFWMVRDQWTQSQKTPTWAVVAAILGFCCLTIFSLFFLLVKETKIEGSAEVFVRNGHHQYVARILVTSQAQVQHLHNQVNYARSLASQPM